MRFLVVTILAVSLWSPQASAQCVPGTADGVLAGSDVEARLYTNGNLFYAGNSQAGGYRVPLAPISTTGQIPSPLYAAGLWLGSRTAGVLRVSAGEYARFDYRPGATGADGVPPTPAECAAADRFWSVSRDDVASYLDTGVATPDLASWPVALGASVADGDGVSGNYNLAGGDQPALSGDRVLWWAMTDAASSRLPSATPPLGLDVQAEAFTLGDSDPALAPATFYRYTLVNRSGARMDSAYVALWLDWDLGNAGDDHVGTDTTRQMNYVYNNNEIDTSQSSMYGGYGAAPPAVGAVVLEEPVGSDGSGLGLTASHLLQEVGDPVGDPLTPLSRYNRMRGLFNDGTRITEGGVGWQNPPSRPPTPWMLAGDPVTDAFWSMENTNGQGQAYGTTDSRGLAVSGPFRIEPDSAQTVLFAIAYGRGTSRLHSVTVLREHVDTVRALHAAGAFTPRPVAGETAPVASRLGLTLASANPSTGETRVRIAGPPGTAVRVTVVDALGRTVTAPWTTVLGSAGETIRVGMGLPAGVFTIIAETAAGARATLRLSRVR